MGRLTDTIYSHNTSGHRGVDYSKQYKKYRARIKVGSKVIHLGYFTTVEEASEAYVKARDFYYKDKNIKPLTIEEQKAQSSSYSRKRNRQLKLDIIDAYGGCCECCGETEFEFLSIDHIYGDGAQHRKELGLGGIKVYKYLRDRGYPKDKYRLLCMNCNFSLGQYGFCPHSVSNNLGDDFEEHF